MMSLSIPSQMTTLARCHSSIWTAMTIRTAATRANTHIIPYQDGQVGELAIQAAKHIRWYQGMSTPLCQDHRFTLATAIHSYPIVGLAILSQITTLAHQGVT